MVKRVVGLNLYRVVFRMEIEALKDREFNTLVVAHSEAEAESHILDGNQVVKVMLVEKDINLKIPKQYLK